jgi:hypothetical protein
MRSGRWLEAALRADRWASYKVASNASVMTMGFSDFLFQRELNLQ